MYHYYKQMAPRRAYQNISGLVVDLDLTDPNMAVRDGSDAVSKIINQSSLGSINDANQTGSDKPTFTVNQTNGLPAVVFDNNDFLRITDNASLNFDSGTGYTIFLVVDYAGYDNQGSSINTLLSKDPAPGDGFSFTTTSGNELFFKSGDGESVKNNDGTINGAAHSLTATMDNAGTEAVIYRDTVGDTNAAATVGSDNVVDLIIGGDTGVIRYAAGAYSLLLLYNRPLVSFELTIVETEISALFGV